MQRTNLSSAILLCLLSAGCSDDGKSDSSDAGGAPNDDMTEAGASSGGSSNTSTLSGKIEVLTFWSDPDLAAIENAADAFMKKNPDVTVDVNPTGSGWSSLDEVVNNRIAKALPMPAAMQKTSPDTTGRLDEDGELAELNEVYAEKEPEAEGGKAWQDVIPESILATNRNGDKFISVATNLARTNSIFYNKKLFDENDLSPPKTIAELKDLVVALSELELNGGAPLVIGNVYNWTLQLFIMSCLGVHLMGPDEFTDYFAGNSGPEHAKFEELLDLALFLRCGSDPTTECNGYFNKDMDTLDHLPSIEAFIAGYEDDKPKYAMAPAGDWVKGWMKDGGLEPGVDFDSFACPVVEEGDTQVFTGGVDAFVMAARTPNPEAALAFTRFLGSKDGQLAINEKKGSIPVRTDINLADYPDIFDAVQIRTYGEFQNSQYFVDSWKPGALPSMGQELKDSLAAGTIEGAYNYVKDNYSTLK